MANSSAVHMNVVNVRSAGSKDAATGQNFGGIYFPAHKNAKGELVSARWEANCFINGLGYTDDQGVVHEPNNLKLRIVAWNGKNSAPGKGLADLMAKTISVGKEFSCDLRMKGFQKRFRVNNVPLAGPDGQVLMYDSFSFEVTGKLILGADSDSTVNNEILAWASYPHPSFFTRPAGWNQKGTADAELWKNIVAQRMASTYNGEQAYGYARVVLPEGAQLLIPNAQPVQPIQQPVQTIVQPVTVGVQPIAGVAHPTHPVAVAGMPAMPSMVGAAPTQVATVAPTQVAAQGMGFRMPV